MTKGCSRFCQCWLWGSDDVFAGFVIRFSVDFVVFPVDFWMFNFVFASSVVVVRFRTISTKWDLFLFDREVPLRVAWATSRGLGLGKGLLSYILISGLGGQSLNMRGALISCS